MGETSDHPIWAPTPDRVAGTAMTAFRLSAEQASGTPLPDTAALHAWSIANPGAFWNLVWDFCGVVGDKGARTALDLDRMPGARFFPDARLNFAENLLRRGDDSVALVFEAEDKARSRLTWRALQAVVSRLQQAMQAVGLKPGDRVAAMMPNQPETVAIMLAASSIGAVFCSCSPDFGVEGVVDRFGQIEPALLFVVDVSFYAGKRLPLAEKVAGIVQRLPTLKKAVIVPSLGEADAIVAVVPQAETLEAFLAPFAAAAPTFTRLPFAHPLAILFSSGTTGVPKCIVHGAGGTLLQHLKEHRLHCDIRADDRVFYFTTCGWMMWNWLTSALASEATLVLWDGSPFHPRPTALFDLAERERVTFFGTSPRFLDTVAKDGLMPAQTHDLGALRTVASTGAPLGPGGFRAVYERIKADVHLASIAGGTDIVSCFVLGDPTRPVISGEIQMPGLGLAVDVWDDDGRPMALGKGELVCTRPFPSMPIGFWNDAGETRYRAAYFERFPGVWHHGDFIERTASGGLVIHGRSDATLNPGGVRIGTAEIYAQVERIPEVRECVAIGQAWDNDVRVVLFVRLHGESVLDADLLGRIRTQIKTGASPRHIPARIIQVPDIPRTKSGKVVELVVRDAVHGRPVKQLEALANPEALAHFHDHPDLRR